MAVYNSTGSGNVHTDRVISGGRRTGVAAKKGMGFKAAAASVARKGKMPMKQAQAVVAAGARSASPTAKKANPNLAKVTAKKAVKKVAKKAAGAVSARQRAQAKTASMRASARGGGMKGGNA